MGRVRPFDFHARHEGGRIRDELWYYAIHYPSAWCPWKRPVSLRFLEGIWMVLSSLLSLLSCLLTSSWLTDLLGLISLHTVSDTLQTVWLSHCIACFIMWIVCWLVDWLTSQQHASVSQGRICSENFTCCHTEIGVADPTFYLTQSQYTDTGPTLYSQAPDRVATGVPIFKSLVWLGPEKARHKRDSNPGSSAPEAHVDRFPLEGME